MPLFYAFKFVRQINIRSKTNISSNIFPKPVSMSREVLLVEFVIQFVSCNSGVCLLQSCNSLWKLLIIQISFPFQFTYCVSLMSPTKWVNICINSRCNSHNCLFPFHPRLSSVSHSTANGITPFPHYVIAATIQICLYCCYLLTHRWLFKLHWLPFVYFSGMYMLIIMGDH